MVVARAKPEALSVHVPPHHRNRRLVVGQTRTRRSKDTVAIHSLERAYDLFLINI
jgi:hypothetical protein